MNNIDEKMFADIIFKEMDLLQGCINRMAKNSFEIKKWAIGLVGILSGLAKPESNTVFVLYLLLVFLLWWLDAYFLKLERNYRSKYNWVIANRSQTKTNDLFDLDPHNIYYGYQNEESNASEYVMLSKTLLSFYGMLCLIFFIARMI